MLDRVLNKHHLSRKVTYNFGFTGKKRKSKFLASCNWLQSIEYLSREWSFENIFVRLLSNLGDLSKKLWSNNWKYNYFKENLLKYIKRPLPCIMFTPQDFESMFGHFTTLRTKGLNPTSCFFKVFLYLY